MRQVVEVRAGDGQLPVEVEIRHVALAGQRLDRLAVLRDGLVEAALHDVLVEGQLDDDGAHAALLAARDELLEHGQVVGEVTAEHGVARGVPLGHHALLLPRRVDAAQRVVVLEARPVAREYLQHHYTLSGIHTPEQKERMVTKWNAARYPVFRRNLAHNLAMLEQLVARCEQRGVRAVIVELPLNEDVVKGRFDEAIAQYREPVQALARERDVPYLDFNRELAIPSADFHDLSHLVEPGRVLWQRRLAQKLVSLMGPSGTGGGAQ